jgi:hypothetical protein
MKVCSSSRTLKSVGKKRKFFVKLASKNTHLVRANTLEHASLQISNISPQLLYLQEKFNIPDVFAVGNLFLRFTNVLFVQLDGLFQNLS